MSVCLAKVQVDTFRQREVCVECLYLNIYPCRETKVIISVNIEKLYMCILFDFESVS